MKTLLVFGGLAVAAFILLKSGLFKSKAASPLAQPTPSTPSAPSAAQPVAASSPVYRPAFPAPLPYSLNRSLVPTYAQPQQYVPAFQPPVLQQPLVQGSSLVGTPRYKIPGHEVWQAR